MSPSSFPADLLEKTVEKAAPIAGISLDQIRNMLRKIDDLGYPQHYLQVINDYIPCFTNSRIVDIGCGSCWYAPFLLGLGAVSYCGLDLTADWNAERLPGDCESLTLSQLAHCFPQLSLRRHDMACPGVELNSFDLAILATVTEHLSEPRLSFSNIADLLVDGGRIYFSHGNYYGWAGHHGQPTTITNYDPSSPAMATLVDWGHVLAKDKLDLRRASLNALRIHELLGIVTDHFTIDRLDLVESTPERGRNRMTPERRMLLAEYYDAELFTEMVYCVGTKQKTRLQFPVKPANEIPLSIPSDCYSEGYAFVVGLPLDVDSSYELLEDGEVLGEPNALHDDIRKLGSGRYSIWGMNIYLSSSDNTDPRENGRQYRLRRKAI